MQPLMPRDVTIITLIQEIRYLRQQIAKTPELHWVGLDQWVSTRPMARKALYSSDNPSPQRLHPQILHTDVSSTHVSPRSDSIVSYR